MAPKKEMTVWSRGNFPISIRVFVCIDNQRSIDIQVIVVFYLEFIVIVPQNNE